MTEPRNAEQAVLHVKKLRRAAIHAWQLLEDSDVEDAKVFAAQGLLVGVLDETGGFHDELMNSDGAYDD